MGGWWVGGFDYRIFRDWVLLLVWSGWSGWMDGLDEWKAAKLMRRWWCSSCGFSKSRDIPYITNPKTKQGGFVGKGKTRERGRRITITLQTTASNLTRVIQ